MTQATISPTTLWTRKRRSTAWTILGLVLFALALAYAQSWAKSHRFWINQTPSLPNWAFILDPEAEVETGAVVLFRPPSSPLVTAHFGSPPMDFVKIIGGMPGDEVTYENGIFHVNGLPLTATKPLSKKGEPLVPGPTGILPENTYFLYTPHPDGFDSRYESIGWVHVRQIIGVGKPIL